jgi:hypothetical protein
MTTLAETALPTGRRRVRVWFGSHPIATYVAEPGARRPVRSGHASPVRWPARHECSDRDAGCRAVVKGKRRRHWLVVLVGRLNTRFRRWRDEEMV